MYSVTNSFGLNAARLCRCGGSRCFRRAASHFPSSACRTLPWKAPTGCAPPSKTLASAFRTGASPSTLPPPMCAKPARYTTRRCFGAADRQRTVRRSTPAEAAFLGELALDGSLRPVSGVLPMALAAAEHGIRGAVRPDRERRRGSRGLCRHHDRLSRPHRPGGGGGTEGHPPPLPAAAIPFDPEDAWRSRCRISRT